MNTHVSLKGGLRRASHGGTEVGTLKEPMTATLSLRTCQPSHIIQNRISAIKHGREGFIKPQELPQWFGAAAADFDTVTAELKTRGFSIRQEWADECFGNIRIKGDPAQFNALFQVEMMNYELDGALYRAPKPHAADRTLIHMPASFSGIVQSVHRLDKLPVANPFFVLKQFAEKSVARRRAGQVQPHTFAALFPAEIYKLQGVPVDQLWAGPGIASFYLSLGGDNNKSIRGALAFVAGQLGMSVPEFIAEAVAGAAVDGDPADGATVENILDAIAHGGLPGTILGLSAGNDDDSFASGVEFGLSYTKLDLKGGSVSWGMRWDNFPQASLMQRWPKASLAATLVNRPVFFASGDDGATDIRLAASKKGKGRKGGKHFAVVAPQSGKDQYGTDAPGCVVVDGGNFVPVGGVELRGTANGITGRTMWSTNGAAGCGVGPFPQTNNERALGVAFKSANPSHQVGNGVPLVTDNAAPPSGPKVPIPNADASSFDPQQVGGTSNASPATCKKWLFALRNLKTGTAVDFMYRQAGTSVFIRTSGSIGPYTADPKAKVDDCQGLGEINYPAASEAASR
jgi:hypothetical protein